MIKLQHAVPCALLLVFCLVTIPPPASGFGMQKGGRSSGVAEILAAGLITGLLMDQTPPMSRPIFRTIIHPMIRHMMPHPHPMHHAMMANRIPMMHPYAMASLHRPQLLMNHALMAQASQQQALTARLNEEIRALEAQESILEALLERNHQGAESAIRELLSEDDDAIPAAALLLETAELVGQEGNLQHAQTMPQQDVFQAAGSENESRYILPRIVRHFVQQFLRRSERH